MRYCRSTTYETSSKPGPFACFRKRCRHAGKTAGPTGTYLFAGTALLQAQTTLVVDSVSAARSTIANARYRQCCTDFYIDLNSWRPRPAVHEDDPIRVRQIIRYATELCCKSLTLFLQSSRTLPTGLAVTTAALQAQPAGMVCSCLMVPACHCRYGLSGLAQGDRSTMIPARLVSMSSCYMSHL